MVSMSDPELVKQIVGIVTFSIVNLPSAVSPTSAISGGGIASSREMMHRFQHDAES